MGSGDVPARELRSPVILTVQCMFVCLFPCSVVSLYMYAMKPMLRTRARPRLTKQEAPRPANLPRMGVAVAFKVVEARVVSAGVVFGIFRIIAICQFLRAYEEVWLAKRGTSYSYRYTIVQTTRFWILLLSIISTRSARRHPRGDKHDASARRAILMHVT